MDSRIVALISGTLGASVLPLGLVALSVFMTNKAFVLRGKQKIKYKIPLILTVLLFAFLTLQHYSSPLAYNAYRVYVVGVYTVLPVGCFSFWTVSLMMKKIKKATVNPK